MYTDPDGHKEMESDGTSGKADISVYGKLKLSRKVMKKAEDETSWKAIQTAVKKKAAVTAKEEEVKKKTNDISNKNQGTGNAATGNNSIQWDASKIVSPGNLSGTTASSMETLAEIGKTYVTNEIRNTIRPNNIGIKTWNTYIESEATTVSAKIGSVSKIANVAGYVAIGIDVGTGVYDNVQLYNEGKIDTTRIGTDAIVDTTSGLVGLGASVGSGALYGSIVPGAGTVGGAVAGFVVGVGYMVGTEVFEPEGKSIKDRAKEGLYKWYTQDNSDWQMPGNAYTNNGYYRGPTAMPQSR